MVRKSSPPLFSILLPTHNGADVVGYSIQSVLAQTIDDFELLIVGDGCTDSTESIVKGFIRRDPRVKWFAFPKGTGFGYGHRNTALAKAQGKYIAFAAHDDLWFPDHLALFSGLFEKRPNLTFAYSRPLWIHADGTLIPSCFNLNNESSRTVFSESRNEIPAQCVVHSRLSGERVGYYDIQVEQSGDWDLWKRILKTELGSETGFISSPSAIHFTASWRPAEYIFQWTALRTLHRKINTSAEFSTKLRVLPEPNRSLQAKVWESCIQNESWLGALRQTVEALLDLQVQHHLEAAEKVSNFEASLARIRRENDKLQNHIKVMEATRGYRALQFVRRLARPFRNIK